MKILLVLNKPNREIPIMESIKREILAIDGKAQVEIKEMCIPGFNKFVMQFKPNVILTFPFTCSGFSIWYYLFKKLFNSKILSLRAEGVIDFSSEYNIQWAAGFDLYGRYLVDYELFWGEKVAKVIGQILIKQKKLSSINRVKWIGYPRLESYFKRNHSSLDINLPARIHDKIQNHSKEKNLFFVTGFHLANYTREDLFAAKDLDAENRIGELLEAIEITRKYRQEWIDKIIQTAKENPQLLIIVKKHPIERKEDYAIFHNIGNILYIYEDVDIQEIMPFAGLFFHYGSTSVADAYLSGVPAIYVYSPKNKMWYSDLGWPSTKKINISKIPEMVNEFLSHKIKFEMMPEIKLILKDVFNIEIGKPYLPSKQIAEIILNHEAPQKIPLTDIYLWKALSLVFYEVTRKASGTLVRKALRLDAASPILSHKRSPGD